MGVDTQHNFELGVSYIIYMDESKYNMKLDNTLVPLAN